MQKKESYRHMLPHFQQPGQAYFVTWNLKDAVPPKALAAYKQKLEMVKNQLRGLGAANPESLLKDQVQTIRTPHREAISPETGKLKQSYFLMRRKYIQAYDDLLDAGKHPSIDLSQPDNRDFIHQSLQYWEGIRLKSHAYAIMPNHVHWVFELFRKDQEGNPVYLQDLLQSVKRFSARQINMTLNRTGALWQKESFDTTIRDERHLHHAIRYTLNNPVKAGLVSDWKAWPGTWCRDFGCGDL
ncbi:MAG: transposase [Mangrovibacterium sp.]